MEEDFGKRLIKAIIADFEDPSHMGKNTKDVYAEMEAEEGIGAEVKDDDPLQLLMKQRSGLD